MAWKINLWRWEKIIFIMKLLKMYWKVEMQILGCSDRISRGCEEILLNSTWQSTVNWRINVLFWTSVHIYDVHITRFYWYSSYTLSWRCLHEMINFDLRHPFYNIWLHGYKDDVWDYYWWAYLDANLVWYLPWYLGREVHSTIEVEYNVPSMTRYSGGWTSSLERFWIWHVYIVITKSWIQLE